MRNLAPYWLNFPTARPRRRHHLPLRKAWVSLTFLVPATVNFLPSDLLDSYKLAAIKLVTPSKEHLEKHYEDLSEKPFFKGLVTCMSSKSSHSTIPSSKPHIKLTCVTRYAKRSNLCHGLGRSWRRQDWPKYSIHQRSHISTVQSLISTPALLGATNPLASAPGTIRGDYAIVNFDPSPFPPPLSPQPLSITNVWLLRMSAATSATAPTASKMPRRKSLCGSTKTTSLPTNNHNSTGFMRSLRTSN